MATEAGTETVGSIDEWTKPPFLRRVRIRGYKSIAFCDVPLQPLTILVGKNAAGKSNFLDALAFLRDVMALGVAEAVKLRGGWSAIACRTSDAQPIELEVEAGFTCGRPYPRAGRIGAVGANSPDQEGQVFSARYNLKLSVDASSIPIIERETLDIADAVNQPVAGFEMHGGIVQRWKSKTDSGSAEVFPHSSGLISLIRPDHPLLAVIGTQPSTDLWAGLRYMAFYNFNPDTLRRPQPPLPGVLLDRDGWNIASVIASLRDREPNAVERVREYLALVTEEVRDFEVVPIGGYETLRFEVQGGEGTTALAFDARSMSDGTLRTLASLMAVFQRHLETGPTVVGIEEPETALHPESVRVLVDALEDATQRTQILLTTHSPDLLAGGDLTPGHVLVVRKRDGQTQIGPVDAASREIIRKELYTLAELQRMDHLEPDAADLMRQTHAMTAAEGEGMPLRIAVIVEGHGESNAIRVLLERLWYEYLSGDRLDVLRPFRKPQGQLLQEKGLKDAVDAAKIELDTRPVDDYRKLVLILIDSEGIASLPACSEVVEVGQEARSDADIACVLPHPMFETWFVAAAGSLAGYNGLPANLATPVDPEGNGHGKGWMKKHLARKYIETIDQPRFVSRMDFALCRRNSPSFAKLRQALEARLPPPPSPTEPGDETPPTTAEPGNSP